jgi:hypothetical protein
MEKLKGRPEKACPQGRLSDFGISHKQSAKWQKLAGVSQADFNAALKEADRPTTNGIIRATAEPEKPKREAVSADALWLWGRLQDFERNLLAADPKDILRTLTAEMLDDVHTLAPRVAAWLKRIGATR